ncbi:serpin family protein [Streptomyces sp. H10-C2]|uniref:serpin family protein n=1 Tax=unclassified Streptomyces TaxID=2593676 RepID=UPI0024BAB5D5|nr:MULTISPECIES: serpin family protein [unclassified Streptomyces]MDJ0343493.1 serpin family protein [Streptomyces sp. PH10-H1]MDJ0371573.1 serpin family protein [Streptomyces sp. H10-C2]
MAPGTRGRKIRGSRSGGGRNPEAIVLELPRLALAGDMGVSPHLAALGVESLFSASAERSRQFSEPLHRHRAVQTCRVRLDEEGMSSRPAAGASEDRSSPGYWTDGPGSLVRTAPMRLDRPFGVSVLDENGTIPLLAGYQPGRPADSRS